MDDVRELHWVTDEEEWSVITNKILDSLLSIDLNRETTWVPIGVTKTLLP